MAKVPIKRDKDRRSVTHRNRGFQKTVKFSLEKVGKPERELKRDQYDARRENMLLNKDGASGVAN